MMKTYGQSYNVPTQQAAEVKYRRTLRATGFEPDDVERIMVSCFPHDAVWVDCYIMLRERFCPEPWVLRGGQDSKGGHPE